LKSPPQPHARSRPILFSEVMVAAILAGRKTQTRRIISPTQPREDGMWPAGRDPVPDCPYGKSGDFLWVREVHYRFGHWEPVPGVKTKQGRMKWRFVPDSEEVLFAAPASFRKGRHHKDSATPAWHKRLARFMPRTLSRIQLEILDVRVQRLRNISEGDARAEGVEQCGGFAGAHGWTNYGNDGPAQDTARGSFCTLWQSINGEHQGCSWADDPWVWCITFRVFEADAEEACYECGITTSTLEAAGRQLYQCDASGCGNDCCSDCSEDGQLENEQVICLDCHESRYGPGGTREVANDC
jgi:hypothetical protein